MVPLLQVLILTMFVIVIYATVGLSFLVDKFHATCYNNITGETWGQGRGKGKGE